MMSDGDEDKMIGELKSVGLDKDMINDYVLWGSIKLMMGVGKIKYGLKEKGMADDEAEKITKKIFDAAMKKDMTKEMEAMMEHKHMDHGHKHCC